MGRRRVKEGKKGAKEVKEGRKEGNKNKMKKLSKYGNRRGRSKWG